MSSLPDFSTSERLSRIAQDQRTVRQHLSSLGTLHLRSATGQADQLVLAGGWQAVEAATGLWIRPLLPPLSAETDSDYFESRLNYGASNQDARVPQAARTTVLAGALLWWQASRGEEPRRLGPGDVATLAPGEAHSYTALDETWCLVCLTPRLCDE